MARVRTFIAVGVESGVRGAAAALQRVLAKTGAEVRWAGVDQMHVTLHFLGDIDDRDIPGVCRAVARVTAKRQPFRLTTAGVGAFPTARRPKTLWAGLTDGADELRALHAALEQPLTELGVYRHEERGYSPHLTLGRVKSDADGQTLAAVLPKYADWAAGDSLVTEVLVMASDLRKDGPEYSVLGRAELTG